MSFQTYNRDIPDAPNNPSNDQPPMKVNTNSIDTLIKTDHHGFNDNLGGYHNIIHQDPQAGNPAKIAGINQIYVKNYTPDTAGGSPDTQLFNITGGGGLSQLTGNSAAQDGWNWVGGILIQWGRVTGISGSSTQTGTVTFKNRSTGAIPFPTQCFSVTTTAAFTGSTPNGAATIVIKRNTLSNLKFDWVFNSNSSDYNSFFWIAIGN